MIRAPAFSGAPPSQSARAIAEKTSASVATKSAIRLTCEG